MHLQKKSKTEKADSKKTVLLIDSSNLIHASASAYGHLSYNGLETGVVYGFLQKILILSNKFKTNEFVFCWDAGNNYRDIYYKDYKKNRKEKSKELTPEEKEAKKSMFRQSDDLQYKILPALGFKNSFVQSWFEADDLLAYWAKKLNKNFNVIMVTSDADMYQCLDYCDIYSPVKKKSFTSEDLKNEFGVFPNQWAMAKAIGGCDGDGVIGIHGAADPKKKTSKALKYLQGKLKAGKIYDKIKSIEGKKIIARNLPVVTLPYMENKLEPMIYRKNRFKRMNFIQMFDSLKFESFLKEEKLSQWEKSFCSKKEVIVEEPKKIRDKKNLRSFF